MALYRLYLLQDGENVGRITQNCADDLDALAAARALCQDQIVEVYTEARLVARVTPGDEALFRKSRRELAVFPLFKFG